MGLGRGDKEGHVARRWVNGQVLWRPLYRRWLLFWDKRIWNILNRVAWSMSKYVFAAFWHGKFGAFFVLIRRRQWHPTPVLLLGKSHGRRLKSMGSPRVGHDFTFTFMHWRRKWQPTPVFLPGESQGREPGGLPSMGSHRVRHDWSDLALC